MDLQEDGSKGRVGGARGGLGRSEIDCPAMPGLPGASAVAGGRVKSRYHRPELPDMGRGATPTASIGVDRY